MLDDRYYSLTSTGKERCVVSDASGLVVVRLVIKLVHRVLVEVIEREVIKMCLDR